LTVLNFIDKAYSLFSP